MISQNVMGIKPQEIPNNSKKDRHILYRECATIWMKEKNNNSDKHIYGCKKEEVCKERVVTSLANNTHGYAVNVISKAIVYTIKNRLPLYIKTINIDQDNDNKKYKLSLSKQERDSIVVNYFLKSNYAKKIITTIFTYLKGYIKRNITVKYSKNNSPNS